MGYFFTTKRVLWISGTRSLLLTCLSGLFLAGCSHQGTDITKLSCSYTSGPKANNCQPAHTASWKTRTASSKNTQKPLAIGRPANKTTAPKPRNKNMFSAFITSVMPAKRLLPKKPPEKKMALATQSAPAPMKSYPDLASVLRHTLRDNPDIGIALAQERGERIAIDIARAGLHPTVNIRAGVGPENYDTDSEKNTGVIRHEFGVDLHQTVYDFGRTQGKIATKKALHNSAGYRRIDKMNKIALEVSQTFLSTFEASEHIRIAQQNVASHKDILRLVTESQKAGNATVADVKRVTTRLEKAKTNLIDLRSRKQKAREEFIRLTGLRPENLRQPPRFAPPLPPKGISSDKYPDNPELLSVRADIDSLRAQAKTAKANLEPTIDLDVSGNVKNNISGETGMTSGFKSLLSFNYKIMDGDARLNALRQVHIRITENKHRYRKKRRDYINDLENSIRTVRATLEKSSLLETRARDSRKVLKLYKAQFKDGSKTVFELLDAQMDLFTTRGEKIANTYGKLRSIYEIYSLRGDLVGRLLH